MSTARLGLDDMAAAIARRLGSAWADTQDGALAALRQDNPEELAAARELVKLHLGSQRQWRLKAQAVRDQQLASLVARRKASGSAREILAALAGGHFLTIRARVPVMPVIRGPWLNELREDIVNATLVAILQNKGVALDARTVAAGRCGWESIQAASKAVAALHG